MSTGTLTRPFGRTPGYLVPPSPPPASHVAAQDHAPDSGSRRSGSRLLLAAAGAEGEEGDAWWRKQAEIRELQEVNRSLLRRVVDAPLGTGTPQVQRTPSPLAGRLSSQASPSAWPLPMPLATKSPGSSAGAASSGLIPFLPGGAQAQESLSRPFNLKLVEENRRLSEDVGKLQAEVLDLRHVVADRSREVQEKAARGDRLGNALSSAERRNSELGDEIEKLQKAKQMLEELEGNDGAAQKAVRAYIDNDLATMRKERNHAEALQRAEAAKWEDKLDKLQAECSEALAAKELAESKLETVRAEHSAAKSAAEGAVLAADEAVSENLHAAQRHISMLEEALQDLHAQVSIASEEHATQAQQIRAHEASAYHSASKHEELQASLDTAESKATRLAELEGQLLAQEAALAAERAQHQQDLEQQQLTAAEERKRLKREAAKKTAELQARSSELKEEADEAAARAKEVERTMHSRISALRQEKQKAENRLRSQLQGVHAECLAERETAAVSQEAAARYHDTMKHIAELRTEYVSQEAECADLQERLLRERSVSQQEKEVLLKELADLTAEASQVQQRCTELGQMNEDQEADMAKLTGELHAAKALASKCKEQLTEESRAVSHLQADLAEARADADGAVLQHEALLEALKKEEQVAETQLQTLLQEATDKQKKLGYLQHEGLAGSFSVSGEVPEGQTSPDSPTVSTALWSWAAEGSKLDASQLASPRSVAATTPKNAPSLRIAAAAAAVDGGDDPGDEGVDGVLRALVRERQARKASRLTEELQRLMGRVSVTEQPEGWRDDCNKRLTDLMSLYEEAIQGAAEDELRLTSMKEREAELREQLGKTEEKDHLRATIGPGARQAEALRKAEARCEELTVEVENARAELDKAKCSGRSALEAKEVAFEAEDAASKEAFSQLRVELAEARKGAEEELRRVIGCCNDEKAQLEAQAATSLSQQLEAAAEDKLVFRDELRELQRSIRSELAAKADENAAVRRQPGREAKLERQLEDLRRDREEAMAEVRLAQQAEASCYKEMVEQKTQEKRLRNQEREAHQSELDLLAAELQQFQDEHVNLETQIKVAEEHDVTYRARLEEAQAATHEEARRGRLALRRCQRDAEVKEKDLEFALQRSREGEARLTVEMQDIDRKMAVMKDQLQKAREDKIADRQRSERQLEKLRSEIADHVQRHEVLEKQKTYAEHGDARKTQEHAAQIQKIQQHSRRVAAELQEAELRMENLEQAEIRLSSSELRCQDLEASEAAANQEHELHRQQIVSHEERVQAAETWGQELARRLQDAEDSHAEVREEMEAHRIKSQGHMADASQAREEANSSRTFAARLLKAVGREVQHLVAIATGQDPEQDEQDSSIVELEQARSVGEEPEALVSRAFTALARTLALLARENARLRTGSGSPSQGQNARRRSLNGTASSDVSVAPAATSHELAGSETTAKIAAMQKELIKLREQNQELQVERQKLATQSNFTGIVAGGQGTQAPAPAPPDLKQKLKQLQQAKTRAEERVEDYKQELTKMATAHRTDLDRLQIEIQEQQQRFQEEQDQLQTKLAAAERRGKQLEAKLKGRAESQKQLVVEKEAVEDQLRVAAKQLEALLIDETKDSDLQRELAALSKQFEQLHAKHRAQLSKTADQSKQLQEEQALRQELEEQLTTFKQQSQSRYAQELQDARAEQVAAAEEVETLKRAEGRNVQISEELQEEVRRLQDELQQVRGQALAQPDLMQRFRKQQEELWQAWSQLKQSNAARRQLEWEVQSLRSARPAEAAADLAKGAEEAGGLPESDRGTASGRQADPEVSAGAAFAAPAGQSSTPAAQGDEGLLQALEEIQETLSARELALKEHKSSLGKATVQPNQGAHMSEMERDFGEFARSVGFKGDVATLWEEAQAQAAASGAEALNPALPRREAPVAADIQLRPAPGSQTPSPPRRGVPTRSGQSGSYPVSPGRRAPDDDPSSQDGEVETGGRTSSSQSSTSQPGQSGPLPAAAQETFQQAEALCQRQRFAEAVPLFRRTLALLEEAGLPASVPGSPAAAVAAEVWAHLGVAMQSLDRVPDAISSYRQAVALDPSLHVCFANLATLHAYLNENEHAVEYISKAIELDPQNPTYAQLRSQFAVGEDKAAKKDSREDTTAPSGEGDDGQEEGD
eukprot:TRINITY_DN28309_c0_g1_i1.p1 TRINITY_DN28309_c0_g1~~TRINITY_DN28309_c0_g1_i1.p1  ORF type:complete len:2149 (-),score=712.35 TRINITY_DN28309_c0_g1_i1:139-6585(-)